MVWGCDYVLHLLLPCEVESGGDGKEKEDDAKMDLLVVVPLDIVGVSLGRCLGECLLYRLLKLLAGADLANLANNLRTSCGCAIGRGRGGSSISSSSLCWELRWSGVSFDFGQHTCFLIGGKLWMLHHHHHHHPHPHPHPHHHHRCRCRRRRRRQQKQRQHLPPLHSSRPVILTSTLNNNICPLHSPRPVILSSGRFCPPLPLIEFHNVFLLHVSILSPHSFWTTFASNARRLCLHTTLCLPLFPQSHTHTHTLTNSSPLSPIPYFFFAALLSPRYLYPSPLAAKCHHQSESKASGAHI